MVLSLALFLVFSFALALAFFLSLARGRVFRSHDTLEPFYFHVTHDIAFGAGGHESGGGDGGEAEGEARYAGRQPEPPAPRQLLFQVSHFGLAFRAGAGAVSLVPAFRRNEFYVIRFGYLPADLLQYPAYFLSSFHLSQCYTLIYQKC